MAISDVRFVLDFSKRWAEWNPIQELNERVLNVSYNNLTFRQPGGDA